MPQQGPPRTLQRTPRNSTGASIQAVSTTLEVMFTKMYFSAFGVFPQIGGAIWGSQYFGVDSWVPLFMETTNSSFITLEGMGFSALAALGGMGWVHALDG